MSSPESDIEGLVVLEDETVDSLRSGINSSVFVTLKKQLNREFTTAKQQEAFAKKNKRYLHSMHFKILRKKLYLSNMQLIIHSLEEALQTKFG
jgi:hypothetical protein